jgi:hypothetical protein
VVTSCVVDERGDDLPATGSTSSPICLGAGAGDFLPAVGEVFSYYADGGFADVCTATLISPRHLLTAAHCGAGEYGLADIRSFRMRWGGRDYDFPVECPAEAVVGPEQPGWPGAGYWPGCRSTGPSSSCDIAVCLLSTPIDADPRHPELSGFADWIRLHPPHDPAGYGRTDESEVLGGRRVMQVGCGGRLPEAEDPAAWKRRDWNRIESVRVWDVPGGTTYGTGDLDTACGHAMHGDSGGPLLLFENGRPFVVGVVSGGSECRPVPDSYTLVQAGRTWRWLRALLARDYGGQAWFEDTDRDGVPDEEDNCPARFNPRVLVSPDVRQQPDEDEDGWGDACDNCWTEPNPDQANGDRTRGPTAECPNLGPDMTRAFHDGIGDACDPCPSIAEHTAENTNARYESEFGSFIDPPLPAFSDACDPDPAIPERVLLEPRLRPPLSEEPSLPAWCAVNDGYAVRFATFGFGRYYGPAPHPAADDDHRWEPVRMLWCSCWDDGTGSWLPELGAGEVGVPGVTYCNRGPDAPCPEDGMDARGDAVALRRGWFDLTNYEWSRAREADETATAEDWTPCPRDNLPGSVDWDGDAEDTPDECLPLGFGALDAGDGVEFRRNGGLPAVAPRMHEVRWRPALERFADSAPPIATEPQRIRLWLRPEPGRRPGQLARDGWPLWRSGVAEALTAAGKTGNQWNNTFLGVRNVTADGSVHCTSPLIPALLGRRVVVATRWVPEPPSPYWSPAPEEPVAPPVTLPAVVLVPLDEAEKPLPTPYDDLRYADPGPSAALTGLAVVVLQADRSAVEAVLPSHAASGTFPPATHGFAAAMVAPSLMRTEAARMSGDPAPDPRPPRNRTPVVLYVFGGRDAAGGYPPTLWIGEEARDPGPAVIWRPLAVQGAESPPGREGAALFVTGDGRQLVLVGGRNDQGALADFWTFDLLHGVWSQEEPPIGSLVPHAYASAAQIGDVAWLAGGEAAGDVSLEATPTQRIDLRTFQVENLLAPGGPGNGARAGLAIAATPEGRLRAFGGVDGEGPRSDLWELAPDTGIWWPLAPDCRTGFCPPSGAGGALVVVSGTGEALVFGTSTATAADDLFFVHRDSAWLRDRELTGSVARGDCDGDTTVEPRIGESCTIGGDWWSRPGVVGCSGAGAATACIGPPAAGGIASTTRVPGASTLEVVGRRAFVGRGAHLHAFDLTDPSRPVAAGEVNLRGAVRDLAVLPGIVLAAAGDRVVVVDAGAAGAPVPTARFRACGAPRAVAATDAGIAVALCDSRFSVVAVRAADDVELIGSWSFRRGDDGSWTTTPAGDGTLTGGRHIEMAGSAAFLTFGATLLRLDITTPASPRVAGWATLPFEPDGFRMVGGFGYLVGPGGRTAVVDLRERTPRVTGGTHDLEAWVRGVRFGDGVAVRTRSPHWMEVAHVGESADDAVGRGGDDGMPLFGPCCGYCGE